MKKSEITWDGEVKLLADDLSCELCSRLILGNKTNFGIVIINKNYDSGVSVEIIAVLPEITFLISGSNQKLTNDLGDYVRHTARLARKHDSLIIKVNPDECSYLYPF